MKFLKVIVVVIPLIVVSIFNTLLVTRLYKATDQWTSAKLKLHEQEMSYKELRDKKVQIENLKTTWMLIIISVSFILLTLPHTFLYFIWTIPKLARSSSSSSRFFFNISPHVMQFTELLYVLNHSINFFLYTVTRNSFRKVLKRHLTISCFRNIYLENKTHVHWSKNIKNRRPNLLKKMDRKEEEKKSTREDSSISIQPSTTRQTCSDVIDYESYWEIMPLKNKKMNEGKKWTKKKESSMITISLYFLHKCNWIKKLVDVKQ